MKCALMSAALTALLAVPVSGEKGGFRGALLERGFGSPLVEVPSGGKNRSNVVKTKLSRKLGEGPDEYGIYEYYNKTDGASCFGGTGLPKGDYCPLMAGVPTSGGKLTDPAGLVDPWDPLTELGNPNCCNFGYDRGIKVYSGDPAECGDGWFEDSDVNGKVGFPIGDPLVFVSCPSKKIVEVTFPAGFHALNNKVMVFRKAGQSFPQDYTECALVSSTSDTVLIIDNTEVSGARATSHIDICWNHSLGTPPEPENCATSGTSVMCPTDTDCIKYTCNPSDGGADAVTGCVTTYEDPNDQTNDCCESDDHCGEAPPTCQSATCEKTTRQCGLTNNEDDSTCKVGDCGVGTCSSGTCNAEPNSDECFTDSDPNDCLLPKCGDDFVCQETPAAQEISCMDALGSPNGCCDANGNCRDSVHCTACYCEPPQLENHPANVFVPCGAIIPDAPTIGAQSTQKVGGICSAQNPIVSYYEDRNSYDSCGGGTITRTWSTANCGGSASYTQTIEVAMDDSGPPITAPDAATYWCNEDIELAIGSPTVEADTCGNDATTLELTHEDHNPVGLPYCGTYTRTWTTADQCGHSNSAEQSVEVTKPLATIASTDVTVQCDNPNKETAIGNPVITELCGAPVNAAEHPNPDVAYDDIEATKPAACRTETRTWEYVDVCGNDPIYDVQTIVYQDNSKPTLTKASKDDFPETASYECLVDHNPDGELGVPDPFELFAEDNCNPMSDSATPTDFVESELCDNKKTITRNVTFHDGCNNFATFTQTITVFDDKAPEPKNAGDFADKTHQCLNLVPPAENSPLTVNDNCLGDFSVLPTDRMKISPTVCADKQTISREWEFDDGCSNKDTAKQTITVNDEVAPTITAPPDISIQCDVPPDTDITGEATAIDNCGDTWDILPYENAQPSGPTGCASFTRTFTAEDSCKNQAKAFQKITYIDEIAPDITLPHDLSLQCGELTVPSATGEAEATDKCADDVTVDYHDSYDSDSVPGVVIKRKWTATDECGNSDFGVQTIIVYDRCDFTVSQHFSGEDIDVNVQVENIVDESGVVTGIEFTVTVTDANLIADLRGVFFHLDGVDLDQALEDAIVGDEVREVKVADNGVIKMDTQKSVSMQGAGNKNVFDVGVAIGTQGIGGGDDWQTASFIVPGVTTDNLVGDVGIRVMSLGDRDGGDRDRSSKIVGPAICCRPEEPVCGNGVVDLGEECDLGDGNNGADGSGCSLACQHTVTEPPTCQSADFDTCCGLSVPEECVEDCEVIDCTPPPPPPFCSCDGGVNYFDVNECPDPARRFLD